MSALRDFDSLPDSAFVRVNTVAALRACSTKTVWRHVNEGILPAPSKLSPGVTAWNVGSLRAVMKGAAK